MPVQEEDAVDDVVQAVKDSAATTLGEGDHGGLDPLTQAAHAEGVPTTSAWTPSPSPASLRKSNSSPGGGGGGVTLTRYWLRSLAVRRSNRRARTQLLIPGRQPPPENQRPESP